MSNILSINTSTPFSASPLDAANASSDELDPRFVEELQGAMGRTEGDATPPAAASETTSAEAETPDSEAPPSLQNLPLMPWAMMNVPANFAPQEGVTTGSVGDALQVDAVAGMAAAAVDMAAMSLASGGVSTLASTAVADGAGVGAAVQAVTSQPAPNGLLAQSSDPVSDMSPNATALGDVPQAPLVPGDAASTQDASTTLAQRDHTPSPNVAVTASSTPLSATTAPTSISMLRQPNAADEAAAVQNRAVVDPIADHLSLSGAEAVVSVDASVASPAAVTVQDAAAPTSSSVESMGFTLTTVPGEPTDAAQPLLMAKAPSVATTAEGAVSTPHVLNLPEAAANSSTRVAESDPPASMAPLPADTLLDSADANARLDATSAANTSDARAAMRSPDMAAVPLAAAPVSTPLSSAAASTLQVNAAVAATSTKPADSASMATRDTSTDEALDRTTTVQATASSYDEAEHVVTEGSTALTTASVSALASPNAASLADMPQDVQPMAHATAVATAGTRQGSDAFMRADDVPGAVASASSDAISTPASLALSTSSGLAEGAGLASRTSGSAESTFASSFVQALMGHVHHPAAAHSQVLEVVPSPAPIAPHQVRLDAGQVQVEVVRLVKQGGGQVVMELTPPDESKFKIDLSISQQGVARVVVDGASESTRSRLEQTVSGLQEQFQQMGLQLQLDMRQPQQRDAQPQPEGFAVTESAGDLRFSRQESIEVQPVTSRPSWEQGQVYLVA